MGEKNPLMFERKIRYVPVGTVWCSRAISWSDSNTGSNRYTYNKL